MLKLKIIMFVFVCCLIVSKVNATKPSIPQKVVVSNPSKYLNIALESEFIKSLEKWQLVSTEHPFYFDGKDSLVYVRLKYHSLQTINGKEFVFQVNLLVPIFKDSISGRTIQRLTKDYVSINKSITTAIQDSTVLFFVRTKEITEAKVRTNEISFNTGKKDLLSYHSQQEYPITLLWKSSELVDSLLEYVPLNSQETEVYKEFQNNIGIERIHCTNKGGKREIKFTTYRTDKYKCSGEVTFFPNGTIGYNLPSSFYWESVPYYEKIRNIVENNLLTDSLSHYRVGSIKRECWFDSIMLKPHFSHRPNNKRPNYYDVFVRINVKPKFISRVKLKDKLTTATMVIYPDSTFRNLNFK